MAKNINRTEVTHEAVYDTVARNEDGTREIVEKVIVVAEYNSENAEKVVLKRLGSDAEFALYKVEQLREMSLEDWLKYSHPVGDPVRTRVK